MLVTFADRPSDSPFVERVWRSHSERAGVFHSIAASHWNIVVKGLERISDVTLPNASRSSFWLNGSAWDFPNFENAETFVKRLVQVGLVVADRTVEGAVRGELQDVTTRTEQRHVLQVTGLTLGTICQIERARRATLLLRRGTPILDVVHEAGYYDQAHLTRSLQRFIGQTPARIARGEQQLSLLYNK
jgi:Helix-turn-helix domain